MKFKSIAILLISFILFALGFFRSHTLHERTGAVDFRNRVVGARIANAGMNPYFFKWSPEFPATFYDPSDESDIVYSRLTSPPTTLSLHRAFAVLPWKTQKAANFYLSWFFLLACGALALRTRSKEKFSAFVGIALVTSVYAISGTWQFHEERGQQYIYLSFFLMLAWALRGRARSAGLMLAPFFRPTLGLSAFLSFRKESGVRSLIEAAGFGVLFLLPVLLITPLAWWGSFFSSAHDWYLHTHALHAHLPIDAVKHFTPMTEVEGDAFISKFESFGASGNPFYHFIRKITGSVPSYGAGMIATFFLVIASGIVLWKKRDESLTRFGLRFFSAIFLVDLFLPSPRGGYASVLFFPALLIAALYCTESDQTPREKLLLAPLGLGLLFSLNSVGHPYSTPLLTDVAFVVGAIILFAEGIRKPRSSTYTDRDNRAGTETTSAPR